MIRLIIIKLFFALCIASAQANGASSTECFDVNVSALNAADAINALAKQTGAKLLFPYDLAKTQRAQPVKGCYSLNQALNILLKDSGLKSSLSDSGTMIISKDKKGTSKKKQNDNGKEDMNNKKFTPKSLFATLVALLFSANNAVAQTNDNSDEETVGLEIIEVTAQKRVTTLQETPIAMSAFDEWLLDDQDIENALDIQFAIPNAMVSGNNDYSIRGVGNNTVGASGADPGVGVHINGVYLTSNTIENEFYDLQAIEVLRGPQGTLYGRNTTAGVVNTITKRPTDEFGFNVTVELASFDSLRTTGALNFVLSDAIKQRFAFSTVKRDGYTKNVAENVDFKDVDGRDQYSIRSSTAFQLSNNTDALLFIQAFKEESDRSPAVGVRCTPDPLLGCSPDSIGFSYPDSSYPDGSLAAAFGLSSLRRPNFYNTNLDGSIRENPSDPRVVRMDTRPELDIDELLVSLEFNHDFGEHVMTGIAAYHDKERTHFVDDDNADGADAFLIPVTYLERPGVYATNTTRYSFNRNTESNSEQKSLELRLASYLPGAFNYTVGAFWMDYESSTIFDFYIPEMSLLAGGLAAANIIVPEEHLTFSSQTPEFKTRSWALFGESYYDITEALKLTVGLRYTEEDKEIVTRTISPISYLNPAFDPNAFDTGEGAWEEFTGKVGLSYAADLDFTDSTLLFGTISRGYKGGGINPGLADAGFPNFDPEYVNSLELGTKNRFLDNTLQINATTFFYKYDGYQIGGLLPNGTAFNTNVDTEVKGAEFEIVAAPIDGLRINLNYSLLDTEVKEDFFTSPDILESTISSPVNLKGNELPFAPDSSIQFGIQYSHAFADNWELTYRAQTYWQDKYWTRIYNSATDKLSSWQQTDFNISLTDISNGHWKFELFVKNASDEASYSGLGTAGAFVGRYRKPTVLEPRTYGLRVQYNFN